MCSLWYPIIEGDHLEITYIPTNYTRDASIPQADALEDLAAHLAGIDNQFGILATPQNLIQFRSIGDSGSAGSISLDRNIVSMGNGATTRVRWACQIPGGWDTSQDPTIFAIGSPSTLGAAGEFYSLEWSLKYTNSGDIWTAIDDQTLAILQIAPIAANEQFITTSISLDQALLVPGESVSIEFIRFGADASDTRGGALELWYIVVIYPRTTFQVTT